MGQIKEKVISAFTVLLMLVVIGCMAYAMSQHLTDLQNRLRSSEIKSENYAYLQDLAGNSTKAHYFLKHHLTQNDNKIMLKDFDRIKRTIEQYRREQIKFELLDDNIAP